MDPVQLSMAQAFERTTIIPSSFLPSWETHRIQTIRSGMYTISGPIRAFD
jgi:hypothetical protein